MTIPNAAVNSPYFRLKVDAGDTGLVDKKGTVGALTGSATQTPITRSDGNPAIRLTNGQLTATLPTKSIDASQTGGGISWAMDVEVTNYANGADFNLLANLGTAVIAAGATGNGNGIALARQGTNNVNFVESLGSYSLALPIGTTKATLSCRLSANQSGGFFKFEVWVGGMTHPNGTDPNYVGTPNSYGTNTLSILTLNAALGNIFDIRDWVIWSGELSNADHAAVADNLRGTIDGSSGTAAALAGNAVAQATATGVLSGSVVPAALAGNATAQATATGALTSSASFTFGTFINNTNSDKVWLNQAVVWSWHQGGRIGQASASVVYGTGTIGSNGLLVATGMPAGAGYGMVAKRNTDATDDAVYYQAGTAA